MPPTTVLAVTGAGPLTGVAQVEVGFYHSCARLNTGQVRCWGANVDGQGGNGSSTSQFLRAKIVRNPMGTGPLTGVTQIALGQRHTCARLNTGQARCWGENTWGEIGDGTTGTARLRARVVKNLAGTGPLTGVAQVDAGESSTCARLANGQGRCWGQNGAGQLGDGPSVASDLPAVVEVADGVPLQAVTQIAVDQDHACARPSTGQARCWGATPSARSVTAPWTGDRSPPRCSMSRAPVP